VRFVRVRELRSLAAVWQLLYAVIHKFCGGRMIIPFSDVRGLIPTYIFNEFGQLTGHFVRYDDIICESAEGRIKIWLNQEAFSDRDPERLICDYAECDLKGV
jgi:hypothetical protein